LRSPIFTHVGVEVYLGGYLNTQDIVVVFYLPKGRLTKPSPRGNFDIVKPKAIFLNLNWRRLIQVSILEAFSH
jgi:hypothetical protein